MQAAEAKEETGGEQTQRPANAAGTRTVKKETEPRRKPAVEESGSRPRPNADKTQSAENRTNNKYAARFDAKPSNSGYGENRQSRGNTRQNSNQITERNVRRAGSWNAVGMQERSDSRMCCGMR